MKERKIVKYAVLGRSISENLVDLVNIKLLDGWQPLGGVSTQVQPSVGIFYIQALVKYEEPQEEEL